MKLLLPAPRLLPFTIAALIAVLALKTTDLARHAVSLHAGTATAEMMASARAAPAALPPAALPLPKPASPAAEPGATDPPPVSDGERAVLLDLRQRRQMLDARAEALAARESILAAAEQKLATRAAELTALQKKLQDLETAREQREDAGWQGLVKVYEAMKPRDAATIFNDLQMPVLLALVDRMKELKAAPILAAMNPDKARDVTDGLAKLRTSREATGPAPPGG